MPFLRPKRYSRRPRSRRALTSAQAKAVRKIAQTSGEKKHFDMTQSAASTLTNSVPLSFSLADDFVVAQGDTSSSRDGDQYVIKDLKFKVQLLTSGAGGGTLYRIYVLQWLDNNEPSGITNIQAHDYLPRLLDADRKYRVLYDKTIKANPEYSTASSYMVVNVPLGKKIRNLKINYDSASAIVKDNISMYITSTRGTASGHVVNGRLDFFDS